MDRRVPLATVVLFLIAMLSPSVRAEANHEGDADVLVLGAGISGLSAALELARAGTRVAVIDMFSVFGGHAVKAEGVAIVDTPLQRSKGIADGAELAYRDFASWGEDVDPQWTRYYTRSSRHEIYDWLTAMGITFEALDRPPGNTVARYHMTPGGGLSMVSAIYRECLRSRAVSFLWSSKVEHLLLEDGRVVGVRGIALRTGKPFVLRARAVLLATGGFQNDLEMVRKNWPAKVAFPSRLLAGSGVNSIGLGHRLAQQAGAGLTRMDHQWNYFTALPDSRYPGRGLNARISDSIWVNLEGNRFTKEYDHVKATAERVLKQTLQTYWAIFDEDAIAKFKVSGSLGATEAATVRQRILSDPERIKTAATIDGLAGATHLPAATLAESVRRYNGMVAQRVDLDFGRFGPGQAYAPHQILKPPFHAMQFFPITIKSMGGVAIDSSGRVLDTKQRPIAGLFAAGELTGFAGINGKAGLEGTFLGPCIVTGRVAGRAVLSSLEKKPKPENVANATAAAQPTSPTQAKDGLGNAGCLQCHDLRALVSHQRPGYWHFEEVHERILQQRRECSQCHAELVPYNQSRHRIDPLAQIEVCKNCHGWDLEE